MKHIELEALLERIIACTGICIDSRKWKIGECFFALSGSAISGNQFAQVLLSKGATLVIVDDEAFTMQEDIRIVWVPDVLSTLQELANLYRRRFKIPVFAITGSNGKTTTKELLIQVMSAKFRTHGTTGNLNNHIGVPLTLLSMPADTEFAIIEMGANAIGEIAGLCKIAEPTAGLITNMGKAHLGGFGGVEGVKKGKSELYQWLATSGGLVFVNKDELYLSDFIPESASTIEYENVENLKPGDLNLKCLTENPLITYEYLDGNQERQGSSVLFGQYNFRNIQAAFAVGAHYGIAPSLIQQAIAEYQPENNRSQIVKYQSVNIILDAYNANPSSMQLTISDFAKREDPKMLILGEMMELGDESDMEHQRLIELVLQYKWESVFLIGNGFGKIELLDRWFYFSTIEEAITQIRSLIKVNKNVLLKGSRSTHLESLIPFLGDQNGAWH